MAETPTTLTALLERSKDVMIAAGIAGGAVEVSRTLPTGRADVPMARLYLRSESGSDDGTPNHSGPSFLRTGELGISLYAGDDAAADALVIATLVALLENQGWLDLVEAAPSYECQFFELTDGEDSLIEAQLAIRVAIDRVDYEVPVTAALVRIGGQKTDDPDEQDYGVDVNGDGVVDHEFEIELPQE